MIKLSTLGLAANLAAAALATATTISDLREWTIVEDPADPGMTASVNVTGTQARLTANGLIPNGTDIGYASVDGADAASSGRGFFFSPGEDFEVAIDFSLTSLASNGGGVIGIGVGEDVAGEDSAGVGLGFANGSPVAFSTAARDGDVDQGFTVLAAAPSSSGRLFVEYDRASGDVTVGVSGTPGASQADPGAEATISAIQTLWDDEPLIVSFFLRSQEVNDIITIPALTSGQVDALFSNFEVLEGTPIRVPEPSAALIALLSAGVSAAGGSRRKTESRRRPPAAAGG